MELLESSLLTLVQTLEVEDELEDLGVLEANDRTTCFTCKSWADHAHDFLTGKIIKENN